jgi:hypothetical protein
VSEKSLKAQYQKWLWALVSTDLIGILFLVLPGTPSIEDLTKGALWRLLTTAVIPVAVLLIVNAVPHQVKCMLVYWKPYGWLPGCAAFTKYGPGDSRIDMKTLAKNVGPLPTDPREQNARWYQLYKLVAHESEVEEAHKLLLMYRDMATITLIMLPLVPFALYQAYAPPSFQWIAAAALVIQYLLTAVSSSNSGIRFVINVLAIHSARKVTAKSR